MSEILDSLFTFPIIMVDGDNEQKKLEEKGKLGLPGEDEEELDIIIGEAEVPYYDLVSLTDRWVPNKESLDKAIGGKFNACYVIFMNTGGFIVPWTKKRFKAEYKKFVDAIPPRVKKLEDGEPQVRIMGILGIPPQTQGDKDEKAGQ